MKKLLIFLFTVIMFTVNSQVIMSWNIQNLGESKFKKDTILPVIAKVIQESKADIIAIQEVVLSNYGDSCIKYIADYLNYNYVISDRTTGDGAERYAYLYNKSIVMNYNHLDKQLQDSLNREPYVASFNYNNNDILIRQVHLVPTNKNPQYEVSKLYNYNDGIICGDFNLTDEHLVFIKLLTKFNSPLKGQLTSLKRNDELNMSYDHFLVDKKITIKSAKVYSYSYDYNRNKISDHLPILIYF